MFARMFSKPIRLLSRSVLFDIDPALFVPKVLNFYWLAV